MRIIYADINHPIQLGRQGENLATRIVFPIDTWIRDYGEGTAVLLVKRNRKEVAYTPSAYSQEEGVVNWDITENDVAFPGPGQVELQYLVDNIVVKNKIYRSKVIPSIAGGQQIDKTYDEWAAELRKIKDEVVASDQIVSAAREEVLSARDEAVDAKNTILENINAITNAEASVKIVDYENNEIIQPPDDQMYVETTLENGIYHFDFTLPYAASSIPAGGEDGQLLTLEGGELVWKSPDDMNLGSGGGNIIFETNLQLTRITQTPVIAVKKDSNDVTIKVLYSCTDNAGVPIGGTYKWMLDNAVISSGNMKQGENSFNLTKYVTDDIEQSFVLIVTDAGGNSRMMAWNVQRVNLGISSTYNEFSVNTADTELNFPYTPNGAVEKTLYVKFDGEMLETVTIGAVESGNEKHYSIDAGLMTHGAHVIEMYLKASINGEIVESQHINYNVLSVAEDNNGIILGSIYEANSYGALEVTQYQQFNIPYYVYSNATQNFNVTCSSLTPEGEYNSHIETVVGSGDTWVKNIWVYKPASVGEHKLTISCGLASVTINMVAVEGQHEILPVQEGLIFDFSPVGLSNTSNDRIWAYSPSIRMSVSENFDWTNGGYQLDSNGEQYFCVKAGTTAIISAALFNRNNIATAGMNFKTIFKTCNVKNPNSAFLTTKSENIGIELTPQWGYFYTGDTAPLLSAPYCEDDVIELDFDVDSRGFIMSYEDGVGLLAAQYSEATPFKQQSPAYITIGSDDCDVWIYRMKAYSVGIGDSGVLKNFIADGRNVDEINSRYLRNRIYNAANQLTPESVAQACPDLRVIKIEAPYFTNDKKNYIKNTTVECLYKGGDPVLDNWKFENCYHVGQGTSSNSYGYSGRNIDVICAYNGADDPTGKTAADPNYVTKLTLGNGAVYTADENPDECKVSLTRESVPNNWFNIKVNIASSENANNALLQKRFDRYLPYTPANKARDPLAKNDMEFVNCVVFIRESNEDISTHREFNDTNWHFYAMGNIGDSKKTDNTRANDPDDMKEFVIEVTDNTNINSTFQSGLRNEDGSIKYPISEAEYNDASNETIVALKKFTKEYTDPEKKNMIPCWHTSFEFRYDRCANTKDGIPTGELSAEAAAQQTANMQKWVDFYKWVITSSDSEFRSQLKDWCVVDSVLYWYLFTERYIMIDSRAKNTFWHYGKCADGQYRFEMWDYDNDTALGINNSGTLTMKYGTEDIDYEIVDGEKTYQYNAADNVFWQRIRNLFGSELAAMYNSIGSGCWGASGLINEFDRWQEQFPEELWRKDIERKYLRTFTGASIDNSIVPAGGSDTSYLLQRMTGRKKYHRRQFERDQYNYIGSKYVLSDIKNDKIYIRAHRPGETIEVVPYADMYINVNYGNTNDRQIRAVAGQHYLINSPMTNETDTKDGTIIELYCGSRIQELPNLYLFKIQDNTFTTATKLQVLGLGNGDGYSNDYLSTLSIGNNQLLRELDVRNCGNLTDTLDVSKCSSLQVIKASGTNLTEIKIAPNSKLEYLEVPTTLKTLTLDRQQYLTSIVGEPTGLTQLIINGTPEFDAVSIIGANINTLTKVNVTNLDWTIYDDTILDQIYALPDHYLQGSIAIQYITYASKESQLKLMFPQVTFKVLGVREFAVKFYNGSTLVNTAYVRYGNSANYSGASLQKEVADPQNWTFARWNPAPNNVTRDIDCYAQFVYNSELPWTWEQLASWSQNVEMFEEYIGGYKELEVNGQTVKMVLVGVQADNANFTFISKSAVKSDKINNVNNNDGGWTDSYMRNTVMPQILDTISIKDLIKTVTKISDGGYVDPTLKTTQDKLWIPSCDEIMDGCKLHLVGPQGVLYPYYVSSIERKNNSEWWTRSSMKNSNFSYVWVGTNGTLSTSTAVPTASKGIVIGFCL